MTRECNHCRKQATALKKCAACSMVWYCNSGCQKSNWPIHLVDCNPGRPITTADRLVAVLLSHHQALDHPTLMDYGFPHDLMPEAILMRIEVYRILIVDLKVKAKTINQWMESGILDTMMRETFDTRLSPDQRRQPAYIWFRNNQSTFGRYAVLEVDDAWIKSKQKAWGYMGHDPLDSDETRDDGVQNLPGEHLALFKFLAPLFDGLRPIPGVADNVHHPWICFGYCGCADAREEDSLRDRYMALLRRINYHTFYQAFVSSSLPKLFADNGSAIDNLFILDVLSSRNYKSVWYLKDFVCAENYIVENSPAAPFIGLDYGFSNCQNVDEVFALRNTYKQVFMRTGADPLALHEACRRGKLFEHVGQLARLKPARLFKRLMKNPYPL